jgi:gluconolactonase
MSKPMTDDAALLPGRLLRRPGPPERVEDFPGVQIDDPRLAEVLAPEAPLLRLHEGTLHGEGTVWRGTDG